MNDESRIFIGKGAESQWLDLKRANRHGLVAGATGTGKTVTLQILAEGFSAKGVPVFMADVKGDLSGISQAGTSSEPLAERARQIGLKPYRRRGFPTVFWDLYGEKGHPVRTTVTEMGPMLLARLLNLNDTQEGVLNVAFEAADEQGLLLLDWQDLRAMVRYTGEHAAELSAEYGNVSKASVGAIQRRLLTMEREGVDQFFGEPALSLQDLMRCDRNGYGYISVLAADRLMHSPRLYSTFLLWLLAELFEELPEVGDPDKPGLVFFFDEAHLLFNRAPRALLEKVEQVVRLIRSKGVGVYFVSQSPLDIPEEVIGQLGNRIQHALRAFTPKDRKAVRAAAQTFRANPGFDASEAITQLGVGEALVSTLGRKGVPGIVDRTLIRPPSSRLGPATSTEREAVVTGNTWARHYETPVDRDSAHEVLERRRESAAPPVAPPRGKRRYKPAAHTTSARSRRQAGSRRQGVGEAFAKSVARSVGSALGERLLRGLLGTLFKGG